MQYEIVINKPCRIWSNNSMKIIDGKIIKETKLYVYWEEIYDSYKHAPSQGQPQKGRKLKSEVLFIQY